MDVQEGQGTSLSPGGSASTTFPGPVNLSQRLNNRFEAQKRALLTAAHSTAEQHTLLQSWESLMDTFHVAKSAVKSVAISSFESKLAESASAKAQTKKEDDLEALDDTARRAIRVLSKSASSHRDTPKGGYITRVKRLWKRHEADATDSQAELEDATLRLGREFDSFIETLQARELRLEVEHMERVHRGSRRRDQLLLQGVLAENDAARRAEVKAQMIGLPNEPSTLRPDGTKDGNRGKSPICRTATSSQAGNGSRHTSASPELPL